MAGRAQEQIGRLDPRRRVQSLRAARLRAAAPRYLASAALLVLVALGLRALVSSAPAPNEVRRGGRAPMPRAADFALQFARAYLTYDAAHPGRAPARSPRSSPATSIPAPASSPPAGAQRVRWAEVASDQPALAGGRVITVAAAVSGRRLPVYLAVTVRHEPGAPDSHSSATRRSSARRWSSDEPEPRPRAIAGR